MADLPVVLLLLQGQVGGDCSGAEAGSWHVAGGSKAGQRQKACWQGA